MSLLSKLSDGKLLSPIDVAVAELLQRDGNASDGVAAAAAWASANARAGHVCVDLDQTPVSSAGEELGRAPLDWPAVAWWQQELARSPLVSDGARSTPLVLRPRGRLYLQRLWQEEQEVARRIRALQASRPSRPPIDVHRLHSYFPDDALDQRRAAEVASQSALTLLCGGPGTGKTTTVCRMLALSIEAALTAGLRPPRVLLLAPTGKAAARLGEAVARNRGSALIPEAVRAHIPTEAQTLHRALGLRIDGGPPRYGAARPLPVDLLIVDEASMIDLEAMGHLLRALPASAQLVLLGDRHQLASVEAGAVLAELSRSRRLQASLVELERSRRFSSAGAIGKLARAIVDGDPESALLVLRSSPEARLLPVSRRSGKTLRDGVVEQARTGYDRCLTATTVEAALGALSDFRVLAAHRRGRSGAEGLNRRIERALLAAGKVRRDGDAMLGRPLLVTSNDYTLGLHNGDVAITRRLAEGVRACFPGEGGAPYRAISPARLPPHDPVYAMTVHKSQGSEWKRVVLVLPDEPSPILTRELLYTAVTRAEEQVLLFGTADVVSRAILTPTHRLSGLAEAIDDEAV